MVKYSDLSEEQKERNRAAHRRWAEKNSRKEYYKAYDEARYDEKLQYNREYREKNPEWARKVSNDAYHRNKNNDRPSTTREYKMWWAARKRATAKDIPFDIAREDVVIPEVCPCCVTDLLRPSLDKVVPILGYVKGNIQVICTDCNTIKSFGDSERHRKIADYIDKYS